MIKEIPYFTIEGAPCANQDNYPDLWMRMGGCAATVACESLLYAETRGWMKPLRPGAEEPLTLQRFIEFTMAMKPFLRPCITGIDSLDKYLHGLKAYVEAQGIDLTSEEAAALFPETTLSGTASLEEAKQIVMAQLDRDIPIPDLTLQHRDKAFYDYDWHWFMLTGYADGEDAAARIPFNPKDELGVARVEDARPEVGDDGEERQGHLFVKVATYGEICWIDFDRLWETGHERRGGLVLYHGMPDR